MESSVGVEFRNVSMRFANKDGQIDAVQNTDLNIEDGEFLCLIGPSGCGKSTLLNMIAGFIRPTSGEVLLDGKPVLHPSAERGVIFQSTVALLPWLNVSDNVGFGLKIKKTPKAEREALVEHYLKLVGLWEFRGRAIYELSGGMQQRVALCRVLVNNPKILLMDEPFGALDELIREKMQEELVKVARQSGKTAFLITHSVEEAIFLGTTVAVMSPRPGRIVRKFETNLDSSLDHLDARAIKSDPAFVALREEVMECVLAH